MCFNVYHWQVWIQKMVRNISMGEVEKENKLQKKKKIKCHWNSGPSDRQAVSRRTWHCLDSITRTPHCCLVNRRLAYESSVCPIDHVESYLHRSESIFPLLLFFVLFFNKQHLLNSSERKILDVQQTGSTRCREHKEEEEEEEERPACWAGKCRPMSRVM